jgi:sugar/nucleoside kinase (ribokinase family)
VLCLGELAWDLRARGARAIADARSLALEPGGASANTARAVVAAGGVGLVCGAVGDDPVGRGLAARLGAEGVDVRLVGAGGARTGLVFVERRGVPGPRAVSYRDPRAEADALAAHVDALGGPATILEAARPGAFVLGTIALADDATRLLRAMADAARAAGAIVAIDVNARPRMWRALSGRDEAIALVTQADLVKASVEDLAVVGLPADALAARLRPGATLVVTDGASPARSLGAEGGATVAPRPARASDGAGAGDAFLAGLVLSRLVDAASIDAAIAAGHASAARWLGRARR